MELVDPITMARYPDLESVRVAVVDVETSGLSPDEHHLLQIAVVVVDGRGRELRRWSSDVRPPRGLLGRVGPRHIHGLSRWRLWRAPRLVEVMQQVRPLLADAVVAGHNVAFDLAFLRRAGESTGVPLPMTPSLCTLALSRQLDPARQRRHRLGDVCSHYGIALDRPHDALADAQATAEALGRLLRDLAVRQPADLAALISAQVEGS